MAGFLEGRAEGVFYDRPCVVFDPVYGYRHRPGECRVARLSRNGVSYDQTYPVNGLGFVSRFDYSREKGEEQVFRIVAFGDSFTEGSFLERNWPDRLQERLDEAAGPGQRRYEVYGFGIDGGGLGNWYRIFFRDLLPNFEFDALIIASYLDNLDRDFTARYSDATGSYLGRFASPFESEAEFLAHGRDRMVRLHEVADAEVLDAHVERAGSDWSWRAPPLGLYGLAFVEQQWARFQWRRALAERKARARSVHRARPQPAGIETMLEERIGSRRALQIFSILEACRARGIPVVLSSVPDLGLLLRSKAGGPQNWHQKELALLARRFGADYFDGYEAFADVAADRLAEDYWLRGDGHWNSRGSDHYAEQLFRFLTARLGSMAEARSSPRGARSTR